MKRVMALIDFSEVTSAVVAFARDMARAFNSELVLVHVIESESEFNSSQPEQDPAQKVMAPRPHQREMEILAMALKKEGINAITQIVQAKSPRETVRGKILQEMARVAPDLIVVGSHGHGRLYQLLVGSVSDTVMRKAACPVALLPSRRVETSGA